MQSQRRHGVRKGRDKENLSHRQELNPFTTITVSYVTAKTWRSLNELWCNVEEYSCQEHMTSTNQGSVDTLICTNY